MSTHVAPFLMFEGRAAEAIELYTGAFPDGRVITDVRFAAGEGPEGTVKEAVIEVGGIAVRLFDSPAPHGFTFTPSMSLFVTCSSAEEVDRIAGVLAEGGQFMMPLDSYDFASRFCWFADRFGVSWQLIYRE